MPRGYWDIHNHILPGVDDGASSMDETYELLLKEREQGVRNIVFTPHSRPQLFHVSVGDREAVFRSVCKEMQGEFPSMRFYLGCEYYVRPNMLSDLKDPRNRMVGTNVVLIEFSTRVHYVDMQRCVKDLIDAGYLPIIAHAERYQCLYEMERRLPRLRLAGARIQLNADSVLGRVGRGERHFCISALKNGHADIIASDAHNTESRSVNLSACMKKLNRKFGAEKTERWFGQVQKEIFEAAVRQCRKK